MKNREFARNVKVPTGIYQKRSLLKKVVMKSNEFIKKSFIFPLNRLFLSQNIQLFPARFDLLCPFYSML